MKRIARAAALVCLLACLGACRTVAHTGPYAAQQPAARDPARAERLNAEAAELMTTAPPRAEQLLREALTADLYCGPAHNNLGVLYLDAGRLYEAAGEFEWARKLLPGHPDPRLNLALALERGGQIDAALAAYRSALEVYPEHLPTVQALARCQIRNNRTDKDTPRLLEIISIRGDAEWRAWARTRQLQRTAEP
jgi:tetratricopeptide (TPR) repeat protein